MMLRLLAAIALLAALLASAAAHEITFSQVTIRMDAEATGIAVQLPAVGLLQQEPPVLPAGTTEAQLQAEPLPAEIAAALATLLETNLVIAADGENVPLAIESAVPAGDGVAVAIRAPPIAGALDVSANLFPDDPLHKVFVDVYRGEALAGQFVLDAASPAFALAEAGQPLWDVIVEFVGEGIRHIFIGPDHILFVLALILLGGRFWTQLKIITAFTVAHSITLTLATLDVVELPSRLVESVIALSIVVVGVHDLVRLRRGALSHPTFDPRALFAFAFGLIHGFGFASVLQELDLPREALGWSLAAFNVGVEIGQVAIVLVATPFLLALRRYAPARVATAVMLTAAAGVVVIGEFWFAERAIG